MLSVAGWNPGKQTLRSTCKRHAGCGSYSREQDLWEVGLDRGRWSCNRGLHGPIRALKLSREVLNYSKGAKSLYPHIDRGWCSSFFRSKSISRKECRYEHLATNTVGRCSMSFSVLKGLESTCHSIHHRFTCVCGVFGDSLVCQ